MTRCSSSASRPAFARRGTTRLLTLGAAMAMTTLLLSGCTLELENRQAAQELAELTQPLGSIYTGWRVFQGAARHATGLTRGAPPTRPTCYRWCT